MRHVWLLATTLFITTEAHAFQRWTCDPLFNVRVENCSPNADPECRPVVKNTDELRELIGEAFLEIVFQVIDKGKPQFLLTKWSSSRSVKYSYDETRDGYVSEYGETLHLTGYGKNEVVRAAAGFDDKISITTFECIEVN